MPMLPPFLVEKLKERKPEARPFLELHLPIPELLPRVSREQEEDRDRGVTVIEL